METPMLDPRTLVLVLWCAQVRPTVHTTRTTPTISRVIPKLRSSREPANRSSRRLCPEISRGRAFASVVVALSLLAEQCLVGSLEGGYLNALDAVLREKDISRLGISWIEILDRLPSFGVEQVRVSSI